MKLTMKFKILFIVFLSLFSVLTFAAESPPPLEMLQRISDHLITNLKQNQSHIKQQPHLVKQLISQSVLPHFDIDGIAHAVVGQAGKKATPAEWKQFKKEVVNWVMENYAAPLASFDDDKVSFAPIRNFQLTQTTTEVRSTILRKNGQQIPVTYRLTKLGNRWKVSDFSVEGVSMVQSYRSQLTPILSEKGFKGVLDTLGKQIQ